MNTEALQEALDDELEIIELTDEEGNKHPFYFYDSIEMDGKTYVLLLPVDEVESDDSPEMTNRSSKSSRTRTSSTASSPPRPKPKSWMLILRQSSDESELEVIEDADEFDSVVAALEAEAEEED